MLGPVLKPVLGLTAVHPEEGCWVLEAGTGTRVKIFGWGYSGEEHFVTGPFAGFAIPTRARRPPS